MLERFRRNCPDVPALCAPIETCDFGGRTFDGAIAWGIIFHLTLDRQRQAIANIARALKPGAPFLFTSGDEPGDDPTGITGQMNGVTFPYFSYGAESYRRLLGEAGCTLDDTHIDAGKNMYYLARKQGEGTGFFTTGPSAYTLHPYRMTTVAGQPPACPSARPGSAWKRG